MQLEGGRRQPKTVERSWSSRIALYVHVRRERERERVVMTTVTMVERSVFLGEQRDSSVIVDDRVRTVLHVTVHVQQSNL